MDNIDAKVEQVLNAPTEEEQLRLEAELLEQTDNGWQEGDPEDQPEVNDADR